MKTKLAFILAASAVFSSQASATQMSLETYKRSHERTVESVRCRSGVSYNRAVKEIFYAYNNDLISWDAFSYAIKHKTYPVISYRGGIQAVCPYN